VGGMRNLFYVIFIGLLIGISFFNPALAHNSDEGKRSKKSSTNRPATGSCQLEIKCPSFLSPLGTCELEQDVLKYRTLFCSKDAIVKAWATIKTKKTNKKSKEIKKFSVKDHGPDPNWHSI